VARSLPVILEARKCTICDGLPLGPRPLLAGSAASRIVIIGQAPGAAAHASGTPWNDKSGERLRQWLGVTDTQFYDPALIALVPMGFCFPGKGRSGDLPPRPECAPAWHQRILRGLGKVELIVLVGKYAIAEYLRDDDGADLYPSITDAARGFAELLPDRIALPHPSPRNNIWLKKNAWFERRSLPALRRRVTDILG